MLHYPFRNFSPLSAAPSGTATPTNDKSSSADQASTAPKSKVLGEPLGLEQLDEVDDIKILPCGAPAPDVPGNWSWEVALRCDKYILEQVEALEDKVAAASMQVPVRVGQRRPWSSHSPFTTLTQIPVLTIKYRRNVHRKENWRQRSCRPSLKCGVSSCHFFFFGIFSCPHFVCDSP